MSQPQTPVVSPSCLDGETIAAWSERTLRPAEAERVEQHLSECARCSALLATFVRSAPEIAVPGRRFWHLRWLVPAASAATVVAIWFALPGNRPVATRDEPAAQVAAQLEPRSTPAEVVPTPTSPAGRQASVIESPAASRAREQVDQRADSIAATPTAPAEAPPIIAPDALAERAPAGALATREASTGKLEEKRANAIEPEAPQAAAAPAPPAVQDSRPVAARAAAGARALNAQVIAIGAFEVRSPNPMHRWRIRNGRMLERSTTGGTTWETVSLPSMEALLGGFSPAPSICWLVGRAGTVLVAADGARFARVAFPEAIDLVSVRADDDRQATVTAADGRSFRTTDRGATWTRNE